MSNKTETPNERKLTNYEIKDLIKLLREEIDRSYPEAVKVFYQNIINKLYRLMEYNLAE